MAEVMAKHALSQAEISAQVISMGTLGLFGREASSHAVTLCREAGLDLSRHRSQGVSFGILEKADAVIVMEEAHRQFLLRQRPGLDNVRHFSFFESGQDGDVDDPMGKALSDYAKCFTRIRAGIDGLVRAVRIGLV